MNIHVNRFGINGEIQKIIGLLISRNQFFVARHNGFMEIGMTHKSAIHKHELQIIALAGSFRLANKSGDTHQRRVGAQRHQMLVHLHAPYCSNTLLKRAAHIFAEQFIVVGKREIHLMIHQSQFLIFPNDIAQLYLIAFQKLSTSRHIKKDVSNHKIGTFRTHIHLLAFAFGGIDNDFGA